MSKRNALYEKCIHIIKDRIASIQDQIKLIQVSANEESKSSMGDKYETGRAQAQLEMEKHMQQLIEAERQLVILQNLQNVVPADRAIIGALVSTSQGLFYLSTSLGMTALKGQEYYCISAEAPIGKLLLGKRVGERFAFKGKVYEIQRVE